jgi:hypothetical protein
VRANKGSLKQKGNLPPLPNQFDPLEHSVYVGRQRLGRYARIGNRKYAAYDANERLLGRFMKLANAQRAFDRLASGGER